MPRRRPLLPLRNAPVSAFAPRSDRARRLTFLALMGWLVAGAPVAAADAAPAKEGPEEEEAEDPWRLVPHLSVQVLGTVGEEQGPALSLRRLRAGLRLEGPDWIDANFEAMQEPLALTPGSPARAPRLREARVTVKLPGGPRLSLGAFRAQLGRENLTPAFQVGSAEKALATAPIRTFVSGRSTGVAPGVNLGELVRFGPALSLRYDVGLVIDRPLPDGTARPALLLGRASLTFGTPEADAYSLSLPGFRPSRPGLSVALQGSVDTSGTSGSVGVDLLRQGRLVSFTVESELITGAAGRTLASSARAGLALPSPGTTRIEPWLLFSHVWREGSAAALEAGAGVAWWINEDRLRVSAGATSLLLSPVGPREAVDRTPRGELLFQIRI